jgi:hypothetical protein
MQAETGVPPAFVFGRFLGLSHRRELFADNRPVELAHALLNLNDSMTGTA